MGYTVQVYFFCQVSNLHGNFSLTRLSAGKGYEGASLYTEHVAQHLAISIVQMSKWLKELTSPEFKLKIKPVMSLSTCPFFPPFSLIWSRSIPLLTQDLAVDRYPGPVHPAIPETVFQERRTPPLHRWWFSFSHTHSIKAIPLIALTASASVWSFLICPFELLQCYPNWTAFLTM